MNIVIFGAPGSGKGTQSEKLIDKYGLHHISTGEVLRDHIARKTPIGQIANTYIKQGQLIPDSLMIRILEEIIDNDPKASVADRSCTTSSDLKCPRTNWWSA